MSREELPEGQEAREIRNKDIPLLAGFFCVRQDFINAEENWMWHQDRISNLSHRITGLPGGGGMPKGLDEPFAELEEIEVEYKQKWKEYRRELRRIQKVLKGIPSRSMRTFVIMKYIRNLPDAKIRRELNMTRRGLERARHCVEDAQSMEDAKWKERYILSGKENW